MEHLILKQQCLKTTIQQDFFEEQFGTRGCTLHSHKKKQKPKPTNKNPCKNNPCPLPPFSPNPKHTALSNDHIRDWPLSFPVFFFMSTLGAVV